MRDVHRMKEKYELSLDNRQIVTLTVGGLVVVAAVFVLGVVVGKKLSTDNQRAAAPDLLAALDQRAALDSKQKRDASLTFQDELTKKPEPIVEAKQIEAPPAARPELPVVVARAPEPKPAAAAERVEPAVAEAKAPELPVVVARAELPVVELKEPRPVPSGAEAPQEAVPTRINTDAGALRDAIARAQKPATRPETSPDGAFTLQLSAFQDRAEAERFAAGLRDKGYAPFIVEAVIPARGTWFRVRMGRFPSREAAGRYLADFKRETAIEAIVTGAN